MRIETLKKRIENAEAKIQKKRDTIVKKQGWIAKKKAKLEKLWGDEYRWAEFDIDNYEADIERLEKEIQEVELSLFKYQQQLTGELAKEEILLTKVPDTMKRMQQELVDRWDEYDIDRRASVIAAYSILSSKEFFERYTYSDYQLRYKTNEQIHKDNVEAAKYLILDLYHRVERITGEITDWSSVHATAGAQGMTVLNGFVVGKEGRCEVESILAGGYNIQRLHVRVLVKEI
jgi:chromosome segregation ATPase